MSDMEWSLCFLRDTTSCTTPQLPLGACVPDLSLAKREGRIWCEAFRKMLLISILNFDLKVALLSYCLGLLRSLCSQPMLTCNSKRHPRIKLTCY